MNQQFTELDATYPGFFPDLRAASTLLAGTDYSGETSDAPYSVFSILLTSLESWRHWEPARLDVRKTYLSDWRRMSFKRMGDGQRARTLGPLLNAANSLHGLSLTVAISKQCKSLFTASPPLDLKNPDFEPFGKWKPQVLEKAFLTLHLTGVLLGGLSAPGQNVLWFTDEDAIAANDQRVRELTNLFAWITSEYLPFTLGRCQVGTTKCDDGTRQLEDFVAIPDLIAGAISEQLAVKRQNPTEPGGIFWMYRPDFSEKTARILWWLSDATHPLKRLLCVIDPTTDGGDHLCRVFHFRDQSGA